MEHHTIRESFILKSFKRIRGIEEIGQNQQYRRPAGEIHIRTAILQNSERF